MTPEKAHKLREKATPGPWERHPDQPRALCNLKHKFAVHMELVKDRGLDPHPEDVANTELIAAAPDLAELVAGLRYEYAAQVEQNGKKYIVTDSSTSGLWLCDDEVLQDWFPSLMDAEDYADAWNCSGKRGGTTAYTVRRLVGDPEVVAE